MSLLDHLQRLLGETAVIESAESESIRVAPRTAEAAAKLLGTASAESWHIRIDGTGRWMPHDTPADVVLSTALLTDVPYFDPVDLVATVGGGMRWGALRQLLADRGSWVALDPPGQERSVGSVVVTGTTGALRTGYGNVRDHVLGLTLVAGDGRIVRAGGRVVKNVAGVDLPKLATGSFGAFGLVASVTLRLRAVPRTDVTLLASGSRDQLIEDAREMWAQGITPAALEILSPQAIDDTEWHLALRLVGSAGEVSATRDAARGCARSILAELASHEAANFWPSVAVGCVRSPVTIRLGGLLSSLDRTLDLLSHHLPEGWTSAAAGAGAIRWSGTAPIDELRLLRHAAAQQEVPLTIERAPWSTRSAVGHFGAYREGVGRLVGNLQQAFDPAHVLSVPVGADA